MKIKGYVLVRFSDDDVFPAVIKEDGGYVSIGDEVMLKMYGGDEDTAIVISSVEYVEDANLIAKLFETCAEHLPVITGKITRDYWHKEEKDA
jgi:hypothetical protein